MVLSIEQLNKSFGANVVLENITAKIEDGDRIGLIGVNGAGKSTLLNLITGDLQADSGSIAVSNDVRVGFLRQNSGLSTSHTIWEEMRGVFRSVLMINDMSHNSVRFQEYLRQNVEQFAAGSDTQ